MKDLLELAFDDPEAAARRAREILAVSRDPTARSYAHQAMGILLREEGRIDEAIDQLRAGVRFALASPDAQRGPDVRATYAGTLVVAGRTQQGLHEFDRAVASAAEDNTVARILMRRGYSLALIGRFGDAKDSVIRALSAISESDDRLWEARTLNTLAHIELALGEISEAERHVSAAERLFRESGADLEALDVLENRGEVAIRRGDLPSALRWYHEAASLASARGEPPRPELAVVWAGAYLSAGLADEAVRLLERVIAQRSLPPTKAAEVRLALALAMLASGDGARASVEASIAERAFGAQERDWFRQRARLADLRAKALVGVVDEIADDMRNVALELDVGGADEAPMALTLAGLLRQGTERRRLWRQASAHRHRANGVVRASAYLAAALLRDDARDRPGALRACAAGLDAIDEHRRLMGSSELRALATTHGRELTEIALRQAAHDPRTLLRWSERTRATALAQPPATSDAATIPASLAALRANGRRLADARQAGEPTEELEKERLRLERAVRTEAHTVSAAETDPQRPVSPEEIVAGVGDGCLVELVDVDGTLHVLVVHNGRVRRKVAGTTAEVNELLGPSAMLLRRASRGRPANTNDLGLRLQQAILGDAARLISDGPVVLAPTARLHGLAWSLLPALHDRPFSVVPSAGQWLRASKAKRPRKRRTVLVAGPDLQSGGAEVPILATRHPDAVLLDGPDATLAAVLEQLDGVDLAHLATHGRFRADSPLFSSLDLVDGPLTVHDLERLRRAPYRVVLSACESGVLAPVGAQELLGLAAALFSIGTAGLVSSVAEVNDAATAELMIGLHDGLARGDDPAAALLSVRQTAADDPVAAGTAAAFVALGA